MVLEKAKVFLVSEMPEELVRKCFLEPYASAQEAFDEAISQLGADAKLLRCPVAALRCLL